MRVCGASGSGTAASRPTSTRSGRQIARVEDRMGQRIKELVPNEREAVDYLRRELEAARGQRYTIKGL